MRILRGPVTDALIVSNLAIFALLWVLKIDASAVFRFGFIPAYVGAAVQSADIVMLLDAAVLRPITAAFLHGGLYHVGLNMLLLLITGRNVEGVLRGGLFAVLYGVSALAAAFAHYIADPGSMSPMIGASGAGSGVIAAYMLIYANKGAKPWRGIPAPWVRRGQLLALWLFINLALEFLSGGRSGIAVYAHIGGFVAGLLLTKPLLEHRFKQR